MRRTTISHFSFLIQARLSNGIKGWHAPRANQQSKKRTFSMLHHDEKTYHQDRHKETIEELPPERLPILLCRDLEAQCGQYFSPTTSGTGPRQCGHISQCPAAYCARSSAVSSGRISTGVSNSRHPHAGQKRSIFPSYTRPHPRQRTASSGSGCSST